MDSTMLRHAWFVHDESVCERVVLCAHPAHRPCALVSGEWGPPIVGHRCALRGEFREYGRTFTASMGLTILAVCLAQARPKLNGYFDRVQIASFRGRMLRSCFSVKSGASPTSPYSCDRT